MRLADGIGVLVERGFEIADAQLADIQLRVPVERISTTLMSRLSGRAMTLITNAQLAERDRADPASTTTPSRRRG